MGKRGLALYTNRPALTSSSVAPPSKIERHYNKPLKQGIHACVLHKHTDIYTCLYTHSYSTCIHIPKNIYIHERIYTNIHSHTCLYTHSYPRIYTHTHTHINTCIYTQAYTVIPGVGHPVVAHHKQHRVRV